VSSGRPRAAAVRSHRGEAGSSTPDCERRAISSTIHLLVGAPVGCDALALARFVPLVLALARHLRVVHCIRHPVALSMDRMSHDPHSLAEVVK